MRALLAATAVTLLFAIPASAAELESDGRIDRGFGGTGIVSTDFFPSADPTGKASAAIVRADGRTIVAGTAGGEFALARYLRNGRPDATFVGRTGRTVLDASGRGGEDGVADLVIQGDGKIVVAGYSTGAEGRDVALARFEVDGALDPSFGVGGVVRAPSLPGPAADEVALAVALTPDGRIVVAGRVAAPGGDDALLARFTAGGAPDEAFSGDGLLRVDLSPGADRFADVAVGSGGGITAVGVSAGLSGESDLAIARFRAAGDLDPSFGGDGSVAIDLFGKRDVGTSVVLRADGGALVGGTAAGPGFCDAFALTAVTASGTRDPAFGEAGVALADVDRDCGETANALVVQSNGKPVLGGGTGVGGLAIARFTDAGRLDPTFGGDGVVLRVLDASSVPTVERSGAIAGLAIGRAGSVIGVGARRPAAGETEWIVVRYTNSCALAAARLRSTATKFGAAERRLRKARRASRATRGRLVREARRAKARMRRALAVANSAC